ncbi:MAG: metallophosphoesterase [Gammaproteobacteria bacterium]|nr:metallophosphoesterase [Gammaproteobacteria bacterium]
MSSKRRLPIFPLIALGYVLIQVYAVCRVYVGLALPIQAVPVLVAGVMFMTFSLPLLWRLEHRGQHRLATVIAWLGFSWMGWVFLFFWISLGLSLIGALAANFSVYASRLQSFGTAALVSLVVAAYGFFDARRVRIERVTLVSPKLSAASGKVRVALISDVHLGVLVGARWLRRLVERLRRLDADVVVSTGDLVDGLEYRLRELAPIFDSLRPRYGKFAVTGNHEYYAGIGHALSFHQRAGFTLLRAESVDITDEISIVGVDDPAGRVNTDERVPLAALARERFKILLKHQPVLRPGAEGLFDLQLSGHVHQGQIFPFGLLVRLVYRARTGLTRLADGAWLYVSRGTGTWGPPMRVAARPEITLIEIEAAGDRKG